MAPLTFDHGQDAADEPRPDLERDNLRSIHGPDEVLDSEGYYHPSWPTE